MSLYDPTPVKYEYTYETKKQAKKPANDGTYKTTNDKRDDPEYNWHIVSNNANNSMSSRRQSTRKKGVTVWRRATGVKESTEHKKHTSRVNKGLARLMRSATFFKTRKSPRSPNSLNSPTSFDKLLKSITSMSVGPKSKSVGPKRKTKKKKRHGPY